MKFPINLALLCILLNSVNNASLNFVSLYFTKVLYLSNLMSINLLGFYGLSSLFGVLSIMLVNQKITNYKLFAISCSVLNGLVFLIFPLVGNNILLIHFLIILLGYFNSMFTPVAVMWLLCNTWEQEQQQNLTNLRYMFTNLGMGISICLNGYFIKLLGYKWFFFINGLILILPIILIIKKERKTFQNIHKKQNLTSIFVKEQQSNSMMILFIVFCLISIIFSQLKSSYTLYLNQYFLLDEIHIGYVFMLSTFTIVVFQLLISKILKKYDHINILVVACLLIGLGMYIMIFNYKLIPYLSSLLWTFGEMIFFPVIYTEIIKNTSIKSRAKLTTKYQLFYVLCLFIGPFLGGIIYGVNPYQLWIFCFILSLMAIIGLILRNKLFQSKIKNI